MEPCKRCDAVPIGARWSHLSSEERLACTTRRCGLVLFVGAGILADRSGKRWLCPAWHELLRSLLRDALQLRRDRLQAHGGRSELDAILPGLTDRSRFDLYEQAELAHALLGDLYLTHLQRALYAAVPEPPEASASGDQRTAKWRNYPYLRQVARLCAERMPGPGVRDAEGQKRPVVIAVVTTNLDDHLEACIEDTTSRRAVSLSGPVLDAPHTLPYGYLPVYHVHGVVPREQRPANVAPEVVLSLSDYIHHMATATSWQSVTQLHWLRRAACLFLGMSMSDIDLARLLLHASDYSRAVSAFTLMAVEEYGTDKPPSSAGGAPAETLIRLKAMLLQSMGVELIQTDSFADMPHRLSVIRKAITKERCPSA